MSDEDIFEASRNVFAYFHAFRAGIADALGAAQALALEYDIFETMGTNQGKTLKEQAGGKEFDIKEVTESVKDFCWSIGLPLEVLEESPTMVRCKIGRCPVYGGSRMAGLDDLPLEAMCRNGEHIFMDAFVKQLNPNLSFQLIKFRSAPDDFCEEAIVLRSRKEEIKRQMWRKGSRKPPFF